MYYITYGSKSIVFPIYQAPKLTSPMSQKIQAYAFRLLLNYKNPKSLKVGYWGTKEFM